jgi:hypothetical protein
LATNEQEQPVDESTPLEKISQQMGLKVAKITDTGSQSGVPLRVWVMIVGIAAICTTALVPLNIVGVVLTVALALTLGSRSRAR